MDVRRLVGENVRRLRLASGLSQEAVAERMGVDRAYVSGLEVGRRNPTVLTLWHTALALQVNLVQLFEAPQQPQFEPSQKDLKEKRRGPRKLNR